MKDIFIFFIRLYQKLISPLHLRVCRFYPSCSEYTAQSIGKYGFWKGSWYGLRRLCQCHPWHSGGYDPVR